MDRRFKITLAMFAVIALVLLWGEHKVHLLGALPWLILLACPLIIPLSKGCTRLKLKGRTCGQSISQ